jgi:hypothetical protein
MLFREQPLHSRSYYWVTNWRASLEEGADNPRRRKMPKVKSGILIDSLDFGGAWPRLLVGWAQTGPKIPDSILDVSVCRLGPTGEYRQ